MPRVHQEAMAKLLASCDQTFLRADAMVDKFVAMVPQLMRKRGEKTKNVHFHTAEVLSCILKCLYVLVAADPRASEDEIMSWLPPIEGMQEFSCTMETGCGSPLNSTHGRCNPFMYAAMVSSS